MLVGGSSNGGRDSVDALTHGEVVTVPGFHTYNPGEQGFHESVVQYFFLFRHTFGSRDEAQATHQMLLYVSLTMAVME